MHVAAEGAVVLVPLQGLKQLDDLRHLPGAQVGAAEAVVGELGEIGLGGGQLGEGLPADVQHIAGVKARGHGAVQGILADEIQGAPGQGVDLVIDENIARTGQGKEQLIVVVKVEPAHIPGVVVIELKVKFYVGHGNLSLIPHCGRRGRSAPGGWAGRRGKIRENPARNGVLAVELRVLYHARGRYANFLPNLR